MISKMRRERRWKASGWRPLYFLHQRALISRTRARTTWRRIFWICARIICYRSFNLSYRAISLGIWLLNRTSERSRLSKHFTKRWAARWAKSWRATLRNSEISSDIHILYVAAYDPQLSGSAAFVFLFCSRFPLLKSQVGHFGLLSGGLVAHLDLPLAGCLFRLLEFEKAQFVNNSFEHPVHVGSTPRRSLH